MNRYILADGSADWWSTLGGDWLGWLYFGVMLAAPIVVLLFAPRRASPMAARFYRGAKVREAAPLSAQYEYPQFVLAFVGIAMQDYGVKDKAQFLRDCELAFDFELQDRPND